MIQQIRKQECQLEGKKDERGEGCNYTSLERGWLICSPLTLSLPFPGSDQRQPACTYHDMPGLPLMELYSVRTNITVPFLSTKSMHFAHQRLQR